MGRVIVGLRLMWSLQAQFAGYAIARELLSNDGVELNLRPYDPDAACPHPIEDVIACDSEFGVASPVQVLADEEVARQLSVVAVFQQESPLVLAGLSERAPERLIDTPPGSRIGVWPDEDVEIRGMLFRAGVDLDAVEFVPVTSSSDALLAGQVDMAQVTVYHELVELERANVSLKVFRPVDFGLDLVKDGLVVSRALVDRDPSLVQAVVSASVAGWARAVDDPDQAVEALVSLDPKLDRSHEQVQLRRIVGLVHPERVAIGRPDEAHFTRAAEALRLVGRRVSDPLRARDETFWVAAREARLGA